MGAFASPALRAARRSLDEVTGVTVVGDWWWHEGWQRWALQIRLRPDTESQSDVPMESTWFVLAEQTFPGGMLPFLPAQENGLTVTFRHQRYNGVARDAPWRRGEICLEDFRGSLGRAGLEDEPEAASTRLRWRAERALEWLIAAAEETLVPVGAPFELPDFPERAINPGSANPVIAFRESPEFFARWRHDGARWGTVELLRHPSVTNAIVIQRFIDGNGKCLLQADWGAALSADQGKSEHGIWLRLDKVPVLLPWQAPATWGELRRLAARQGLDLDRIMGRAVRSLRDGTRHVALIGFPVPRNVGEPSVRMHWQALLLPELSRARLLPNGRRSSETTLWREDRDASFASDTAIDWLTSENWHPSDLATRGRYAALITDRHVMIIGAGALGSAVAELLVRSGVTRVTLIDGDVLQAGNLVRHTLALPDLLSPKASAVASRLNLANPNARVDAVVEQFPPIDTDQPQLQVADVVIDTTGSNHVTAAMADFPWRRPRLFASLSLSLGSRRMYLYLAQEPAFPNEHFRRLVDPLVIEDHAGFEGELPWEAIGCWHPVFPGRSDDVWLLTAAAVKRIVAAIEQQPSEPGLIVIEQVNDAGQFVGVQVRQA
jgi:hypothetical protein